MHNNERWTVGELAEATGLTVRTLHHWEQIGLLDPARTGGGHRSYTGAEVTRIYQIMALKQLGLTLEEIVALFAGEALHPETTLRRHLSAVEHELRQRQVLADRLRRVLRGIESDGRPADVMLLIEVIETMTMFENKLSPQHRDWFAQRREQLGEAQWQAALAEWPALVAEMQSHMDSATDPADPAVQWTLSRWDELTERFLGDDEEIRAAAGKAWQQIWAEHPGQLRRSASVAPPELWDYVQRARNSST